VLDARQGTDVSAAVVVRREGDRDTGDAAADEAYEALGVTYDFFLSTYGLDSYDGDGAELRGVVHYGQRWANGAWDGRQLLYGDGDEKIFRRFTYGLDMTAHEFSTAAVSRIRPLVFEKEPGALLTSLGDVFGVLVKQYREQQTAEEANWLLGDTLLVPRPGIRGRRSLKDPGTAYDDELLGRDPQPAHMKDYVHGDNEVHVNGGIPNRAFYLVATTLGGPAWETAGRIWWAAVQDRELTDRSTFEAFADATVRAAAEHAGVVFDAWRQVGVLTPG